MPNHKGGGVVKQTSQRSLLFRQNVNRTEAEWVHFLDGYRDALIEFDMKKFGDDWHTAEDIVEEIFLNIVREPRITARPNQHVHAKAQVLYQAVAHEACGKAQRRALSYNADAGRRKARNRGGVPRPRSCRHGRRVPRRRQGVYRLLQGRPATVANASRVR